MLTSSPQLRITDFRAATGSYTRGLFSSHAWLEVLSTTYGFRVVVAEDPETGYAFPFAEVTTLRGRKLSALPFSDYLDVADPAALAALVTKVRAASSVPLSLKLHLSPAAGAAAGLGDVKREAFLHRIPLGGGAPVAAASHRRAVRKARRLGVTTRRSDTLAALERFYELHFELRRDKFASLPQPFSFFEAVHAAFLAVGDGFVLEAYLGERLLAALLVLRHGDVLYYKLGASRRDSLPLRPNNLLFADLIDLGRASGAEAIDLGLSGGSPEYAGLVRFKEDLGGVRGYVTTFEALASTAATAGTSASSAVNPGPPAVGASWLSDMTAEILKQPIDAEAASRFASLLYRHFA